MSWLPADLPLDLGGDPLTKTLSEIRSIVRFRGDMRNTLRFPDADINKEIQAAFGEGYAIIAKANEGYFDTDATVDTTVNIAYVPAPSGAWRIRSVDRYDGTDWIPVNRVSIKDRNRFDRQPGKPDGHRLTNRGIDLYPTPDATYTLRVIYTPVAPTLDDNTPLEYYNGWEEFTIFGALVRLYLNQNRDASEWQQQLELQRARLLEEPHERNASGPEYLNLHEADGADWDLPPTWSW